MQTWIKIIPSAELDESKLYFLGRFINISSLHFWSVLKNQKREWTSKPGIAVKYYGRDSFRELVESDSKLCAVEIPADAEKRWKKRK